MKLIRMLLTVATVTLPLHAASAQGKAPTNPKMTPEQRTAAQARLNQEAATATAQTLDASKVQLRTAAKILLDSVHNVSATVALLTRAQSTNSVGVERSQARRLRGDCAAVQRTTATTLTRIAELHTANVEGSKLLNGYRANIGDLARSMGECDKSLATIMEAPSPSSAKISAVVKLAGDAVATHSKVVDGLMRAMEIPLRP